MTPSFLFTALRQCMMIQNKIIRTKAPKKTALLKLHFVHGYTVFVNLTLPPGFAYTTAFKA